MTNGASSSINPYRRFTGKDRCDGCGGKAELSVLVAYTSEGSSTRKVTELLFCGNDARTHRDALVGLCEPIDERVLVSVSSGGASTD